MINFILRSVFGKWALPQTTKVAIFNEKGEILLIQRAEIQGEGYAGTWDLPGGNLKFRYDWLVRNTALRETEEETGIELDSIEKIGNVPIGNKLRFLFKAVLDHTPKVVRSREHMNDKWVAPEELNTLEISPRTEDILRKLGSRIGIILKK